MKLSDEQIEKMKQESEQYKEQDDKKVLNIKKRNELENLLYNKKNELDGQDSDIRDRLMPQIDEGIEWLDANNVADTETYENKINELMENLGLSKESV